MMAPPDFTHPQPPRGASLTDLTWEELANRRSTLPFVVLATGSIEQHGPHLPLGADFMVADRVARALVERFPALHLPLAPFGTNFAFANWPGDVGLGARTYEAMLTDVLFSVSRICPRILVVNGHDENQNSLVVAAREVTASGAAQVVCFEWAEMVLDVLRSVCESRNEMHAGEGLTSLFLHWFPDHVRRDRIDLGYIAPKGLSADDVHAEVRAVAPRRLDPGRPGLSGVFGDPRLASADKGATIAAALIERACTLVHELSWDPAAVEASA